MFAHPRNLRLSVGFNLFPNTNSRPFLFSIIAKH
uniref:Uncharacterized protein n=1 Tax=Arundo donax TaxID=35708 RepID=A0A0A8ZBV9_ARUDO